MHIYALSVFLILPSMFPFAACVFPILPLIYVKSAYDFSALLLISSIFFIICCCYLAAGRSLLQSWQSPKECRNMQRKGIHFQGRGQQEREDTKGKTHSDVAGSMDIRTSTRNSDWVEGPAQVKHVKRIQSGRPKVPKSLCDLATLWACLQLPTVAAAYELKSGVDMTGSGTTFFSMILLMSKTFVSTVWKSVQNYKKIIHECGRGFLANPWYIVWVIVGLLSMVMVLAPAINDENGFEAGDDITKALYLVFAIFFAALVPRMRGTCRVCKKATCTCPNGPGGGSGASLGAAATHLDIEMDTSH